MSQALTVLLLAGSRRQNSLSRRLLQAVRAEMDQLGLTTDLVVPADLTASLYDGDVEKKEGVPTAIKALNQRMDHSHALVIVTPEYNGLFPALLKNTLDWMSRKEDGQAGAAVFRGKPVLLLGSSDGVNGGLRALPHLRTQMANLGMHVYGPQLAVGQTDQKVSHDGVISEDALAKRLRTLTTGFAEFVRKLSS
ncbi:MAG: NAD(P)H-dependent oxidoreductase [Natronospirillum sp.]